MVRESQMPEQMKCNWLDFTLGTGRVGLEVSERWGRKQVTDLGGLTSPPNGRGKTMGVIIETGTVLSK